MIVLLAARGWHRPGATPQRRDDLYVAEQLPGTMIRHAPDPPASSAEIAHAIPVVELPLLRRLMPRPR